MAAANAASCAVGEDSLVLLLSTAYCSRSLTSVNRFRSQYVVFVSFFLLSRDPFA